MDSNRGRIYGAAIATSVGSVVPNKGPFIKSKQGSASAVQIVSAVQTVSDANAGFTMHEKSWIGAVNLTPKDVNELKSLFKCPLCRSNDHTYFACFGNSKYTIVKKEEHR